MPGHSHSAFVDRLGTVWTVGLGDSGELGRKESSFALQPVKSDLPPCRQVQLGAKFTVCLTKDSNLYYFGTIYKEEKKNDPHLPKLLTEQHQPVHLSCGHDFLAFIDSNSEVFTFGVNDKNQLGLNHTFPVCVPSPLRDIRAKQVACGLHFTVILTEDEDGKRLYGWGESDSVRIDNSSPAEIQFPDLCDPHSIHCGNEFIVIRSTDNTLWTTGNNAFGQLGLSDRDDRIGFSQIPDLVATQVSCGSNFVLAIDDQSRLWGWGDNGSRQLIPLDGRIEEYYTKPILLRTDAREVLSGHYHTFLRTTDDQVLVCGDNEHGQLALGHEKEVTEWTLSQNISVEMIGGSRSIDWEEFVSLAPTLSETYKKHLACIDQAVQETQRLVERSPMSIQVPVPHISLGSWQRCHTILKTLEDKLSDIVDEQKTSSAQKQEEIAQAEETIRKLEEQLKQEKEKVQRLKQEEEETRRKLPQDQEQLEILGDLRQRCEHLAKAEEQLDKELQQLLNQKGGLEKLNHQELDLVWWKMGVKPHPEWTSSEVVGQYFLTMDALYWNTPDRDLIDGGRIKFTASMLSCPGGLELLSTLPEGDEDCRVCHCLETEPTIHLLREMKVDINEEIFRKNGWILPYLIYTHFSAQEFGMDPAPHGKLLFILKKLRKEHKKHVARWKENHKNDPRL